jgi:hypothetical protein
MTRRFGKMGYDARSRRAARGALPSRGGDAAAGRGRGEQGKIVKAHLFAEKIRSRLYGRLPFIFSIW